MLPPLPPESGEFYVPPPQPTQKSQIFICYLQENQIACEFPILNKFAFPLKITPYYRPLFQLFFTNNKCIFIFPPCFFLAKHG